MMMPENQTAWRFSGIIFVWKTLHIHFKIGLDPIWVILFRIIVKSRYSTSRSGVAAAHLIFLIQLFYLIGQDRCNTCFYIDAHMCFEVLEQIHFCEDYRCDKG